MARRVSLLIALFAFWAMLSGQLDITVFGQAFLTVCGVISCLFVVWIASRMGIIDMEGHPVHLALRAIAYVPWLFWQIVLSNFDVAMRVWHPSRPIAPRIIRVPNTTRSDLATVIYANSITLTPGTVTIGVDSATNELIVHALTKETADAVLTGDMERRVKRLEGVA
ncbi:MAG: Na+/H+ antiporter subunit E [Candidatus Poribacteria bacterium]|nr:Na+/H+ antiporter subunit E [Candidatus Poribacteria bacterium]